MSVLWMVSVCQVWILQTRMSRKVAFPSFQFFSSGRSVLPSQLNFRPATPVTEDSQMKFRSTRWAECGRKLCHFDYLSALRHAANLPGNETVVIYPCSYCDALHVGHQRWRNWALRRQQNTKTNQPKLAHDLNWRLARCKRRIARAEAAIANIHNPRESTVRKYNQRLNDLRKYLAQLQTQLCNRAPVIKAENQSQS